MAAFAKSLRSRPTPVRRYWQQQFSDRMALEASDEALHSLRELTAPEA
jgi:hypothetical protein